MGLPIVPEAMELPADLRRFYELCDGADLFLGADFECSVVAPSRFVRANPVIVGEKFPDDRGNPWFVVATAPDEPLAVIDLDEPWRGRCYDAFHEVFGISAAGSTICLSRATHHRYGRRLRYPRNRPIPGIMLDGPRLVSPY